MKTTIVYGDSGYNNALKLTSMRLLEQDTVEEFVDYLNTRYLPKEDNYYDHVLDTETGEELYYEKVIKKIYILYTNKRPKKIDLYYNSKKGFYI